MAHEIKLTGPVNHFLPRYENDCKMCSYLGRFREFDMYACGQGAKSWPTIVARYGNAPSEYSSGLDSTLLLSPAISESGEALRWGLGEAIKRNLISVVFRWVKEVDNGQNT